MSKSNAAVQHACWECGKNAPDPKWLLSQKHREAWLCSASCEADHDEPAIWRVNIAPGRKAAYKTAIEVGVVGFGWKFDDPTLQPTSWEEFHHLASRAGWRGNWKSVLTTLENKMCNYDLVWTRDQKEHKYYIGRITGKWRYSIENPLGETGLCNVRDCEWYEVPADEYVPTAFLHLRGSFRELSKAHSLRLYSKKLFNKLSGVNYYKLESINRDELWKWFGPEDCEDIVGLYIQKVRGYFLQPSSCKTSTPDIEYSLTNERGEIAVAQVKSGEASLDLTSLKGRSERTFVFCVSGNYNGKQPDNVEILNKTDLTQFLDEYSEILPGTVRAALEHCKPSD